jgi:hypothetical protein
MTRKRKGGKVKSPIEWHERSLANMKTYYRFKESELDRLQLEVEMLGHDILEYEQQISRAKREKRDGFDRDRFMVKKGGKDD